MKACNYFVFEKFFLECTMPLRTEEPFNSKTGYFNFKLDRVMCTWPTCKNTGLVHFLRFATRLPQEIILPTSTMQLGENGASWYSFSYLCCKSHQLSIRMLIFWLRKSYQKWYSAQSWTVSPVWKGQNLSSKEFSHAVPACTVTRQVAAGKLVQVLLLFLVK